ncbi:MAG: hypothetical protein HY887_06790 [Deltaproteobacteria bacterium]|nr:hypothetical protein [Deltaproteobacteria bacterium]
MGSLDLALTLLGIAYGFILIAGFFIRNRFTEIFRLDKLFMANPSFATSGVNLIAGIAIAGYNIYSLLR